MRLIFLALLLAIASSLSAQDRISLLNPSFEDVPRAGSAPQDWLNCGPADETPPDIHPNDLPPYNFFGVNLRPDDGWTYLGMVTRQNGTREAVTQKLTAPLQANAGYLFSLWLARSEYYASGTRQDPYQTVDFSTGAVLRIWGGNAPCAADELLALTTRVENTEWMEYAFTLRPSQPWTYLTFEAFYQGDIPYNGHVLADNCSDLVLLPPPLPKEDLEAMDEAMLETAIIESVKKRLSLGTLTDLTTVPLLGVCYKTAAFEEEVKELGLRRYVNNAPFEALTSLIRALEALRVDKNVALLKEVTRISRKPGREVTPEEYQYFEQADAAFDQNLAAEPIRDKRLEFIRLHRNEVIAELAGL